jgi:hypothetical protein
MPESEAGTFAKPKAAVRPLPLRELLRAFPGATVDWLGRNGAKVIMVGHLYVMKPGTNEFDCDGKVQKIAGKFELVGDKFSVPEGFADVLKGVTPVSAQSANPVK